jgi:DNA-binding transcriptional MerR regulator
MLIQELAKRTGVRAKTIRYYEAIALLPPPARQSNNYRQYGTADVERVCFIRSARSLGFSLEEIAKILGARDAGVAPCTSVLAILEQQLTAIDRQIADMRTLRDVLTNLYHAGKVLPRDDVVGEHCVCTLMKTYAEREPLGKKTQAAPHG